MCTGSGTRHPKYLPRLRTPELVHRCRSLADLIECVLPIAGVGPDLTRPAAQFDGLGPRRTDQHVWPLDLVEGAIPRPRVYDLLLGAADAYCEGFALDAGDGVYARHLEQIGDVLGVVDLIEESLLVRIHVHACDEEIFRGDRHTLLLSTCRLINLHLSPLWWIIDPCVCSPKPIIASPWRRMPVSIWDGAGSQWTLLHPPCESALWGGAY